MGKPIVIYHKGCADGVAAAWCFWKQFGDSMDYVEGVYGNPPPDVTNCDIYLVDFSYKRDIVKQIAFFANKVVVLDHHQSALDDLWDLSSLPDIDMSHATLKKSGAMIAWEYVKSTTNHGRKLPPLLEHIQDRDLWKFELENTREILNMVFAERLSIANMDKFMGLSRAGLKGLAKQGKIIRNSLESMVAAIAKQCARTIVLNDYEVPLANANGMFASELGNNLAREAPFAATYYDTKDFRIFSLRSVEGGADVSEVAKVYGGGGHPRASGFRVTRDHFLAKI